MKFSLLAALGLAGLGLARPGALHADTVAGRHFRVHPTEGADTNDGINAPFCTIAQAVKLAGPGDTVHLAPVVYRESLNLATKRGEPGRPITVEGHGAILEGSDPVTTAGGWEEVSPGLHRKTALLPRMDASIIGRWFFLWDGRMNHMGRTSKGPKAPLKAPDQLAAGEWTYVEQEDAFYLRLAPGQTLDGANISYPARSSGVIIVGGCHDLVVRQVTSTHVWNDGFNLHGVCRNCVFENIAAIECGDDGFSAHGDCHARVEGFRSIGNSTGITDVNSSVTEYRNVFIQGCHGFDLYFIGDTPHRIENAVVESSAASALAVDGTSAPEGKICTLTLKNVLLRRVNGPQEVRVGQRAVLDAEGCTFEGLNFTIAAGETRLRQCLVTGGSGAKPAMVVRKGALWKGADNTFDIAALTFDETHVTPETFSVFQQLTGGDATSRWGTKEAGPAGADEDLLRKQGLLDQSPSR